LRRTDKNQLMMSMNLQLRKRSLRKSEPLLKIPKKKNFLTLTKKKKRR
jgi:hypothetical protein